MAVVGDCGAPPKLNDYTAIGDVVNLSARLESANKQFGTGILIDGATHQGAPNELLLQVFTQTLIGPIFFEVIQRKGDQGFGEGNFRALFESIELDQVRRGVLKDANEA